MTDQVFNQAKLLSGIGDTQQLAMLKIFCQAAVTALTARLRDGLTTADCAADFIASASLFALAAFSETDPMTNCQQIQLGDVTVRPGSGSAAAKCLRYQAEMMMSPYCTDGFSFRGV
jgi:hypothetical protein